MGAVVPLPIKPKTLNRTYKRQHYTVTFVPATKQWKWEVVIKTEMRYSEEASTQLKAFKAAEKFIDQNVRNK